MSNDLQLSCDVVAAWARKWRFKFGVGPTKSVAMVFGPARLLHIRKLISRGNRLFAQCVSWCRSEHLPLAFASNVFHTDVLPSVSWGAELCSGSTPAVRLLDGAIRRGSRCLLGWPRRSPVDAVHLESGWPDAQRLITGRLLSLFGRITSMPIGNCSPPPANVSRVMASFPGSLIASFSDLCAALEIVTPSSFGVGPGCSVQRVRDWFTQCAVPPLDRALRDRPHCPPRGPYHNHCEPGC